MKILKIKAWFEKNQGIVNNVIIGVSVFVLTASMSGYSELVSNKDVESKLNPIKADVRRVDKQCADNDRKISSQGDKMYKILLSIQQDLGYIKARIEERDRR